MADNLEEAGEFNPLLDSGEEENYSQPGGEEEDSLESFSLPSVEELQLPAVEVKPTPPEDFSALDDILGPALLPSPVGEEDRLSPLDSVAEELGLGLLDDTAEDTSSPGYQESWGGEDESWDELAADLEAESSEEDEDELMGFNLDAVLGRAIDVGASDVDLIANDQVSFEVLGDMRRADEFGLITPEMTTRLRMQIVSHVLEQEFVENFELDTAYVLRSGRHRGRRTRLSVGKSFGELFLVFRIIADVIPTPDDLLVPKRVQDWCLLPSGLVLICGPTGSGKSSTFASMIRKIQLERPQKIITIEKPIEYVFGNDGKAVVVQREVGRDSRTFAGALKSAMRQHPKVIMVGEVRDQEEVDELLRAAETGHLALTTLHATTPPGAVNRIMSLYEGEDRLRILSSLKTNLRGIANQTLVKSPDGRSRSAVHSMLPVTPAVADMIGEGDVNGLEQYMRREGLTMEHGLVAAVGEGRCTLEEARSKSSYPAYFDELAEEAGLTA